MQSSTWAWFVRNVQWAVPSLDIDDTVILYFVSRFSLLVSFITRSVSEVSKPVGSSHKEGEREMSSVDPLRITVDKELNRDWERDGSTFAYGIRRERSGEDIFVISLAGEHDLYTAPKVQEALRGVIAAGARTIVVDLTETTFLDSTMLHALLSARNELRDGGRLLLVTNDETVKRAFEIAGIDRFFDFYPSRRAAEEEVRST